MDRSIFALVALYLILLVVDLGANLLSFIPFLGSILESGIEVIIELMSAIIVGFIVLKAK
jgi:hypothetical protein